MKRYEKLDTPEDRQRFREERKRLSENHFDRANTIGAWLLATLAASNLAAAAAVLAYVKAGSATAARPALAFAGGIVLAIISGFVGSAEAHWRSSLYYLESYGEENLADAGLEHLKTAQRRSPILSSAAQWLNYFSLAAFIAGAIWAYRLL